ncbi:hypothetical protein B566_EDAN016065 [Ephemera danica]|nr:hypothetical protein B566_EDAN016065 [Ephemera danica]
MYECLESKQAAEENAENCRSQQEELKSMLSSKNLQIENLTHLNADLTQRLLASVCWNLRIVMLLQYTVTQQLRSTVARYFTVQSAVLFLTMTCLEFHCDEEEYVSPFDLPPVLSLLGRDDKTNVQITDQNRKLTKSTSACRGELVSTNTKLKENEIQFQNMTDRIAQLEETNVEITEHNRKLTELTSASTAELVSNSTYLRNNEIQCKNLTDRIAQLEEEPNETFRLDNFNPFV